MKKLVFLFIFLLSFIHVSYCAPAELFGTTLIADISQQVSPSVVAIESVHYVRTRSFGSGDPLFDRFFSHLFEDDFSGYNNVIPQRGSGSGVIISKDGYLLTNEHVISSADEINVKFGDGNSYKAKIIGKDKTNDLAVLKIDSKENFSFVQMGDSDNVRVGEWVIAIGNPFGLGITVTAGVVSAIKRDLAIDKNTNYTGLIQTDASINPGNSGGALINSKGQLIGINTAIMPSGQGIGFAIPVNRAKRIVGDLIKYGKVKKVSIGITLQNVTKELAEYFNVPMKGLLISSVEEDSSASECGLVPSDIIISVDNLVVNDVSTFNSIIDKFSIGQKCKLKIYRKGKLSEVSLIFKETKASQNALGIAVKTVDEELIEKFNLYIDQGCVITEVINGSPAYEAGLKKGDIILSIDKTTTLTEKSFEKAINQIGKKSSVIMRIVRKDTVVRLILPLK